MKAAGLSFIVAYMVIPGTSNAYDREGIEGGERGGNAGMRRMV